MLCNAEHNVRWKESEGLHNEQNIQTLAYNIKSDRKIVRVTKMKIIMQR